MPDEKLQRANQEIKKSLRRNSILVGILAITGIGAFIPTFSVTGSRFDLQEFCFKPENAYEPEKYCSYKENNVYQGLAWRVALEIENSLQFSNKVYLLRYRPSERPYTGVLGLISASLFLTGYLVWQLGSISLSNNLFKFIREKQENILEEVTAFKKHEILFSQLTQNEIELATKAQELEQAQLMERLAPKSEGERAYERLEGEKHFTIGNHIHELNIAKLKAQTAEQVEKEKKHTLEAKKLESKLSDPWDEPEEKQSLESLLKNHEDGWLWHLVKGISPIIVYGRAGSAKSFTAASLVLAKSQIKGSELVSIADPDFLQNKNAAWKHIHKSAKDIFGEGGNWDSYAEGIDTAFSRWIERTLEDSPIVSIWDELTLLGRNLKGKSQDFMPAIIATPRKRNEDVILITHSVTQTGLGDCEGMSDAIKDGCYRLKLKCNPLGQPLFKGFLYGWTNEEGEEIEEKPVTIPEWFRPDELVKLTKTQK